MIAEANNRSFSQFIQESEAETFQRHYYRAYYMYVVLHEIYGHGTGKLLAEDPETTYNFDHEHPPIDPLTNKPVSSWYKPGQTWTGQFGDLATTLDECRAELVGAYLIDDRDLLALFDFTDKSEVTANNSKFTLWSARNFNLLTLK